MKFDDIQKKAFGLNQRHLDHMWRAPLKVLFPSQSSVDEKATQQPNGSGGGRASKSLMHDDRLPETTNHANSCVFKAQATRFTFILAFQIKEVGVQIPFIFDEEQTDLYLAVAVLLPY